MNGFAFHLFSNHTKRSFNIGDAVFVWLRSNRSTGRAVVLQTPDALPDDSEFAGRYQVQFRCTGQTAHVRPERLLPVYKGAQLILVTAATEDYRRLARSQVDAGDVVLELGCSYGMCTNMLAEHAATVIGLDNSEEVVAEARRRYPHVRFEVADVLNDPAAVLEIASATSSTSSSSSSGSRPPRDNPDSTGRNTGSNCTGSDAAVQCSGGRCNVVFADIGGNRQLEALLRLMPWVLQQLKPRLLVVKSEELAEAAAQQLQLQQQQCIMQQQPQQQCNCADAHALRQELLQQQQQCASQREEQLQQLPLHGQVQQLQLQLQLAVALEAESYNCNGQAGEDRSSCSHATQQSVLAQQQLQQQQVVEQEQLMQQCAADNTSPAAAAAAAAATAAACLQVSGQILNPQAWWDQLEVQCGLNPLLHAGRAEPWFLAARAKGFVKNPLRYPQRFTAAGVRICRPYNYDRCFKIDSGCAFDHLHCHHCGAAGHRAVNCSVIS